MLGSIVIVRSAGGVGGLIRHVGIGLGKPTGVGYSIMKHYNYQE